MRERPQRAWPWTATDKGPRCDRAALAAIAFCAALELAVLTTLVYCALT